MAKRDTPEIDETRNCHLIFELTQDHSKVAVAGHQPPILPGYRPLFGAVGHGRALGEPSTGTFGWPCELTQKIGRRSAVSIRARDQKTIASTGRIQDRKSECCQTVDHPCKWGASIQVAVHRDGRFGRHRRIGLAHRNSMRGEFSIARGASGTVMRHFVRARAFAAPAPVAPLALGMTVPAAPRVLIPASRPAQRFTPSEAAAARPAVVLAPVTARADEHLAPASGTQKQSGIVHRSSRRGGLDDPRLPGNTASGGRGGAIQRWFASTGTVSSRGLFAK